MPLCVCPHNSRFSPSELQPKDDGKMIITPNKPKQPAKKVGTPASSKKGGGSGEGGTSAPASQKASQKEADAPKSKKPKCVRAWRVLQNVNMRCLAYVHGCVCVQGKGSTR